MITKKEAALNNKALAVMGGNLSPSDTNELRANSEKNAFSKSIEATTKLQKTQRERKEISRKSVPSETIEQRTNREKIPKRARVEQESDIQKKLFAWAELARGKYPELALMFHVANGGKRDAISGYHLKLQGVRAGVPDICLPVARGSFHSLWIELKAAHGRVQDSQWHWIDELTKQGHRATVCYGFDEAKREIESYLSL